MENTQPAERQTNRPDEIEIVDVWYTIQGEGPFAGMPAVFVRLAGCQYKCTLCDTNYTTSRHFVSIPDLMGRIKRSAPDCRLVVLTGGEPFRQNLSKLVSELFFRGYITQVETNGGIAPQDMEDQWDKVHVVVSPKSGYVHPRIRDNACAWKYVVESGFINNSGLPTRILGVRVPDVPRPHTSLSKDCIYIQPLDEQDEHKNRLHMIAAAEVCLMYGYRLCLQVHKIAGVM